MLYLVGDSSKAKSFVLIDAKSQHYYTSKLETTWKSLDAFLYPMTMYNLNKLYNLKKQVEVGLEVLFLPLEPYVTGQAKYLALEKFREHYVSKPWEGVPSSVFLDKFVDLWVSQGGCNHEDLQNFLKQAYVKLDSNSFDPYKYESRITEKFLQSKVSTKSKDFKVLEEFQKTRQLRRLRNGLKNLASKRLVQYEFERQKNLEKASFAREQEEKENVRKNRCQRKSDRGLRSIIERKISKLENYTIRKNRDIETAVFTNTKGEVVSVKDFLLREFGSTYLNTPFTTFEIVVRGRVIGGQLTLNLTGLSRTVITDFVFNQEISYNNTFRYANFSFKDLKDSEFKRLQTKFDYRCYFDFFRESGLFFTLGLNSFFKPFAEWNEFSKRYETTVYQSIGIGRELTRTDVYNSVSYWFEKHTDIVNSVKYKERQWLIREVIESTIPNPKTNIVYVCYLPDSQVIKVGRTENWVSRRGVYTRSSGSNPKTNGRMRLCYFWETFKTGDSVVDKYIMFCAEDHLKKLASSKMTLVEGKEYFEGFDINDFVSLVKDYFSKLDLQTLLQIRTLSKLKQFAQNERYNTERLIVKLRQLANM